MNVLINPIITEKSMNDVSKNRYTFKVVKTADKKDIKKEVEKRFGVNVIGISTIILKGRKARSGARRVEISLPHFKKAILTLKAGQKIGMFETGGQENNG